MDSSLNFENGGPSADMETELQDVLKHIEQKEEEANMLKQLINFYKDERLKMTNVLQKMQMLDENGDLNISAQAKKILEEMVEIQEKVESAELSEKAVGLSQAEKIRKQTNYISKLKSCIKVYTTINERLTENTRTLKLEVEQGKQKVGSLSVSSEELSSLEVKLKRYENELVRFEKRYPWLKSSAMSLPKIAKEMETLTSLRVDKAKLEEELSAYQGLKPDVKEATQQLTQLKLATEKLNEDLI